MTEIMMSASEPVMVPILGTVDHIKMTRALRGTMSDTVTILQRHGIAMAEPEMDGNIPMTKDALLASIQVERDPNVLWPLHKMGDDFDVMKAAANRIYELTEGGKNR